MKNMVEVYCLIDDLVKFFEKAKANTKRGRKAFLSKTDYVFLLLLKQEHGFKENKKFYNFIKNSLQKDFGNIPSYQQFILGINNSLRLLAFIIAVLCSVTRKKPAQYHIIDSTPLPVCNNQYRFFAKVAKNYASSGKNMNGWFFGFKLHIIINQDMEIEAVRITGGSKSDISVLQGSFIEEIIGYLIGDKGYISAKKAKELAKKKISLIVKARKNMKKNPVTPFYNYLLSQRQKVESVFSFLKHRLQLINPYARSIEGFLVNVLSALMFYMLRSTGPIVLPERCILQKLIS